MVCGVLFKAAQAASALSILLPISLSCSPLMLLSAKPPNLTPGNWAKFVLTDRSSRNLHGAVFFFGFFVVRLWCESRNLLPTRNCTLAVVDWNSYNNEERARLRFMDSIGKKVTQHSDWRRFCVAKSKIQMNLLLMPTLI
jgi:hypothetical protein